MLDRVLKKFFRKNKAEGLLTPLKTDDEIVAAEVERIICLSQQRLSAQMEAFEIPALEKKARNRINELALSDEGKKRIKSKITGVIPLLIAGEIQLALNNEMLKNKTITSSILQPFCNATEIMICITFILHASDEELEEYGRLETGRADKRPRIYDLVEKFEFSQIEPVLNDYRKLRNLVAHTYKEIPIEAAQSFLRRTYESIQRLALIANS